MKAIIEDCVLQHYTWKGTLKKPPFIQFKHINDVVVNSIRSPTNAYTDHDHNMSMKEYCKHAKNRLNSKGSKKLTETFENSASGSEDLSDAIESDSDHNDK